MDMLQEFGIRLILVLQQLSPSLDGVMNFFTFLGKIEFYLIIIPFIYWTVNKRIGVRLLLILITTDVIASTFKLLFHQPRPYWLGRVAKLAEETSYGIPSSHASDSLAVWGYLAYRLKKTWLWALIVVFVFFIGVSRLYLGVHFPHDVLFGWLIGLLVLWAFIKSENQVSGWAKQQNEGSLIAIAFAISLVIILVGQIIQIWLAGIPDPPEWSSFATQARTPAYSFTLAGALFGVIAGYVLMKRYAPFANDGSWLQQLGRYVFGIACLLVFYFGLDTVFSVLTPDETILGYSLRFLRYAAVTFLVTFLIPWLFLKIGLAHREATEPGEVIARATRSGQEL